MSKKKEPKTNSADDCVLDKNFMIAKLEELYPTARFGFIKILMDALELHAKKNNDYNGKNFVQTFSQFETFSKFYDIRRKYNRLYHIIAEENNTMVDEKLEDTVLDLGNYAFLLAEYLKNK